VKYTGFTVGYHYADENGAILFKQLVRVELPESVEVPPLDGKTRHVIVLSHLAHDLEIETKP
jgi:hypothetical protein